MNIKRVSFLVIGFMILATAAQAKDRFQAGGYFLLGTPQNEFNEYVDRVAYGGSLYITRKMGQSPFHLGFSFDFMFYDWNEREVPFSLTVPDVFVNVVTTNTLLRGLFFLRLQPSSERLRPYLDGLAGLNHLRTDTRVEDLGNNFESIASTNRIHDTVFTYGLGAGIMMPLVFLKNSSGRARPFIDLDLGIRFLKGGQADYMVEAPEVDAEGLPLYDTVRSGTDLLSTHLGLSFHF